MGCRSLPAFGGHLLNLGPGLELRGVPRVGGGPVDMVVAAPAMDRVAATARCRAGKATVEQQMPIIGGERCR